MLNKPFYEELSVETLDEFAQATFGDNSDLSEFTKHFGNRKSILEFGCGTGRLGIPLVAAGYNYTGIDAEEKYLEEFVSQAERNQLENPFDIFCGNILEYDSEEKFDIILFSWTVIGDFSDTQKEQLLAKCKTWLTQKGLILIDNPAMGEKYNKYGSYESTPFHYLDWQSKLTELGFTQKVILYQTETGRKRELVILHHN